MDNPIIALMTDFGEADFFVPSLKGVIASINPKANVLDVSHSIPSFDVLAGSFVLFASYRFFPKNTIFVAVVDPGVGSARKILLVETKKYYFIAPDNGILSLVLEEEDVYLAREISNPKYFLQETGVTFEGRDKMVPVSAWLSLGLSPEEFGPQVSGVQKKKTNRANLTAGEIHGAVLYKDKFGNLITNIPFSLFDPFVRKHGQKTIRMIVGDNILAYGDFYSAVPKGEPVFLSGSFGIDRDCRARGFGFYSIKGETWRQRKNHTPK